MRPIRVLHFRREVPTGGGPETLILGISRCIDRSRFDMKVAVLDSHSPPDSPMSVGLQQSDTPIVRLKVGHRLDPRAISQLASALSTHQIDVLHTHDHRTNLIGYLATRLRPTPLVATLHQPLRRHWWLRHFEMLDEFVVRRFDRVLPVAQAISEELISKYPAMADRTISVLNGVDFKRFDFPFDRAALRAQLSVAPDQMLCMTVGRLSEDKGLPYLLESIRLVIQQRQDIRWKIVGRGPLAESLKAGAASLGLDGHLSFLGFRDDIPDLLRAADVLVVASVSEGCPVVVLEAMAAGCPVICTRVGGTPEIVSDGETGLIVEPRQPRDLANAILHFAQDSNRRCAMGHRAAEIARERFTIEHMTRKFEDIYTDLVAAKKLPTG